MTYTRENGGFPIRSIIISVFSAVLVIFTFSMVGCEKVEPGWAAVKVNQFGGSKGVQPQPITTGIVWYVRPMHDVYQFPTFTQTANWTEALDDANSPGNDAVTFNSAEGAVMKTDLSVAYHFELEKIPTIFTRFRKDADGITHGYVLQRIRDQFNKVGPTFPSSDIMGLGKVKLIATVKTRVNEELLPIGIIIEDLSFFGDMRIDESVRKSINEVIQARQAAERTRQQVEQEKAEADKKVQQARGRADSLKMEADAQAYADRARADALSYANEKISASLTEKVMQIRALEKWNGVLPTVMGSGSTPFITLPK